MRQIGSAPSESLQEENKYQMIMLVPVIAFLLDDVLPAIDMSLPRAGLCADIHAEMETESL